jgi:hypothetical protein
MRIVNTLYNEPPDEIEQIVKMTDTEYEQIKSDRTLLEEAVRILSDACNFGGFAGCVNCEDLKGCEIDLFLTRAKERLG